MNPKIIKQLIETQLPDADVKVESEDGTHFKALIISELFSGKSMLHQHRMVYEALGSKIGKDIHALSLKTYTPQQYKNVNTI